MSLRVVVYNEVSLDGRVVGFPMDGERYYARGFRWHSDAILMGSTTAQAFGPAESAAAQARPATVADVPVPPGFEQLVAEPRPLLVVPDSRGVVRCWPHALAQPWYRGILVLVSASTPAEYLAYLERRGVPHLTAGTTRVDLAEALSALEQVHGITAIRTDGGGRLNGALLAAGLVDEIAVILKPTISGQPTGRSLSELPRVLPDGVGLELAEVETLADGALWLRYEVRNA